MVSTLCDKQKNIIRYYKVIGMEPCDIAVIMNISEDEVWPIFWSVPMVLLCMEYDQAQQMAKSLGLEYRIDWDLV